MVLTKEKIQKDIWKRDCFLYLILGVTLPILSLVLIAFHVTAFFVVAPMVFLPCMVGFVIGTRKYSAIKNGTFFVIKHRCTNKRTRTYTVDNSDSEEHYAVFGKYGEYKLRISHSECICVGK